MGFENILKLLIEKGVSVTPSNDLGFLPKDVTFSESIIQSLSIVPTRIIKKDVLRTKSVRPNYSTPDRFKLLRDLAEESSVDNKKTIAASVDRKKSEGHYFRKGRVKETQQKVLIEEEVAKKESKRQLEVAQLVKKSAVKNNPLWKKMEKRTFTSPTPSPSNSGSIVTETELIDTVISIEEEQTPKRNSKVISSLKTKSYVSSSIFVQADEDAIIPSIPTISLEIPQDAESCVTEQYLGGNETQGTPTIFSNEPSELDHEDEYDFYEKQKLDQTSDEDDCYFRATNTESLQVAPPQHYYEQETKQDTQTSSEDYSDDENDYDEATPVQFATRLVSPIYKSVVILNEEKPIITKEDTNNIYYSNSSKLSDDSGVEVEKYNTELDEIVDNKNQLSRISTTLKQDEILFKFVEPSSPPPVRPQRSDLRRGSSNSTSTSPVAVEETPIIYKSPVIDASPIVDEPHFMAESPVMEDVHIMDNSPVMEDLYIMDDSHIVAESPIADESTIMDEAMDRKRMSGSQKAAWTMSMSSWAAILDREFNLDELQKQQLSQSQAEMAEKPSTPTVIIHSSDPIKTRQSITNPTASNRQSTRQSTATRHSTATIDYLGSGKLQLSDEEMDSMMLHHGFSTTAIDSMLPVRSSSMISLSFKDFEIPSIPPPTTNHTYQNTSKTLTPLLKPPQLKELPQIDTSKSISRKPIASSLSEASITKKNIAIPKKVNAAIPAINLEKKSSKHGKLYLHVNGIQDILLPLPKDRAYVRCVVSDGRFEYMSRYEILSQNINFDYECVIDTHPDMIITISLHVRPDYVMKSRTPFSRLFSSKKKKESLSGYVNKEDGAIGQARFALAHMLPACIESTYLAGFHCFNAWYSRSFKERHRQKKKDPDQDVLKVVGNFDVEMLYLPVADFQKVKHIYIFTFTYF